MTTPKPPPPAELVGALQDRVHREPGKSRPAKAIRAPRPKIQLPELPVLRDPVTGQRLCAVETIPGLACGDPHRSSGRCARCYARDYAAELRRLQGRPPATTLDEPVKVTAYLPAALLAHVDARCPARTISEQVRRALEQWVASTPAP